jgi:hypothetical protein
MDDSRLLFGRQFRFQLFGDRAGDVALDGEDVSQVAIVSLRQWASVRASINCALTRTLPAARCTLPSSRWDTPSCCPISRRLRGRPLRYCITLERLMTFRSAMFARSVRISSCTPSAKYALSLSLLRFSKGRTATLFSGIAAGFRAPSSVDARRQKNQDPAKIAAARTIALRAIGKDQRDFAGMERRAPGAGFRLFLRGFLVSPGEHGYRDPGRKG